MQDFPPNSARARARSEGLQDRSERIGRVTSAEAVRRKRGLGKQFKDTFIGGNARMAIDYAMVDIVVPAIRDLLFDAVQGGLDRLIYGESRRPRRGGAPPSSYSFNTHQTNYQAMSSPRPQTSSPTRMLSRRARTQHDFYEIVIASRAEAQEVLDQMFEWLDRYGEVKVSELYEMTGISSSHTDTKWGWTALPGAKLVRLRNGGFSLDLPEPEALRS